LVTTRDFPQLQRVVEFLKKLQSDCCDALQKFDPTTPFQEDRWEHRSGGGGITRVIENGRIFEKGGVNFSNIRGDSLPDSATASRSKISGKPFQATGVSLVLHPQNPFVPTCHMNVRFIIVDPDSSDPEWWFGGGYDLTPCYGFDEDCRHWHQVAKTACDEFDPDYYERFKLRCDEYFFLKHRNEARGVGGLFFDDFNEPGFSSSFAFVRRVGESFISAYTPIVEKRWNREYDDSNKRFQCYRRGRYVEFNLVYDRGTLFGLQSRGRTESILMSLPPLVEWRYNWAPEAGSDEQKLTDYYLQPRDWINP
jgi:coproporphyrinogen III oxidase